MFYYLYMNTDIRQQIIDDIYENDYRAITGDILQRILLGMVDRTVFLSESEYDHLYNRGLIDEDKIYYIYEDL